MVIRLNFVVEGQTEETFVNRLLAPELGARSIGASARCVMTKRTARAKYRGGIPNYEKAKNDILNWMREDSNADARFTSMFDLYRLPNDFPGYEDAMRLSNPYKCVSLLEDAMREDISDYRFIPYIQLHEFEALLLSEPGKFDVHFLNDGGGIRNLVQLASEYESPELINQGAETSPSKRIIKEMPRYEKQKASAGPRVAEAIGLPTLRAKCKHFSEWLEKLESLT